MVHMAYFWPQMVTWSDILVALDVYPRPTNASTQCCCAFLSIVTNGFRTFVVFTIGLFLYHRSLVTDFRPCLVVWVYGVVAPSWSLMGETRGDGWAKPGSGWKCTMRFCWLGARGAWKQENITGWYTLIKEGGRSKNPEGKNRKNRKWFSRLSQDWYIICDNNVVLF